MHFAQLFAKFSRPGYSDVTFSVKLTPFYLVPV